MYVASSFFCGNLTDIFVRRSVQYSLPERLRMHPAQAITLRASTNIQGLCVYAVTKKFLLTCPLRAADLFEVSTLPELSN